MSQESKQKLNKLNTRTSWSGSTQNVNYRVSTWPALAGVSKGKPGKQNTRLLANDEDHIAGLATQTHITAPPDMNIPQLFENILIPPGIHLWSLSLIGSHTKLTTQTLQPLSNIACLGFLDLSETDVSLQTLQTCLRPVQIMRLHLFHCPNILSTVTTATMGKTEASFTNAFMSNSALNPDQLDLLQITGISADASLTAAGQVATTREHLRGFLVFSMPNVWVLDSVPILHHERQKWTKFYSEGGKGQFSDLVRKHYIEDAAFIPRKKKQYPNNQSPIKAEYIYESPIQKKLWSTRAKKVIGEMPPEFNMPIEKDLWRLKRLAADLERRVIQTFPSSVFSLEKIRGSVAAFVGVPNQHSPIVPKNQANYSATTGYSIDDQISLALLIFGSLVQELPVHLAQAALETIFEANEGNGRRKQHWAQRPVSPLLWRVQERLEYLGLLLATIEMNLQKNPNSGTGSSTAAPPPELTQLLILSNMALLDNSHHQRRPQILSRLDPLRQSLQMMQEVFYSFQQPVSFTNGSYETFEPVQQQPPSPPPLSSHLQTSSSPASSTKFKHITTTTHLVSNQTILSHIRTTPILALHHHPKTSPVLMNHALLQLEILPFLICKSSSSHHNNSNNNDSIPASDFIHLFPGIQMVLEHVAGWAIRLCIQRGDCPPSITSVIMRPVSRSRSRSRSRNRSRSRAARFSNWTSQQPELAPYEKVLRISMEGVIGAREIREWMAEERKNSGFGGEGGGRGGGEEKKKNHDSDEDDDYNEDDDEDDDELAEVGSSLDGLVFQMKLKVLEAVDSIVRIVYGAPTESCLPPTSKSPEPDHLRHQITPSTDANADLMDATEYESDDEMRMFDLMRSLRIARHPRDPVPSSLVLKGKKMA